MKSSKIIIINLIIGYTMSAIASIIMAKEGFFTNHVFSEFFQITLSSRIEAMIVFILVGFVFSLMLCFICSPILIIIFSLEAKDKINKKYVDTKESIYIRDLPEYNAVIAGELYDLKSNFEIEYIAGIIELISKGYLIEKENEIIVDNSKTMDELLKNEKYIMNTFEVSNTKINSIEWNVFHKELKEDMYDLGLYNRRNFLESFKNYISKHQKLLLFLNKNFIKGIIIPVFIIILFFTYYISIPLIFLMSVVFIKRKTLTPKGTLEKEKIGKLRLFLERETNFKEKEESERKIWGRYSAFAVALGLNTEIKKDIYRKIEKKIVKYSEN